MPSIQVLGVYRITGIGSVITAKVMSGTIFVGMQTRLNGASIKITQIEKAHQHVNEAKQGDAIGLLFDIRYSDSNRPTGFFAALMGPARNDQKFMMEYVGKTIEFPEKEEPF